MSRSASLVVILLVISVIFGLWPPPVFGEEVTWDEYKAAVKAGQEVEFRGLPKGDGKDLTGQIFIPEGAGPFPAFVAMHGAGGIFPYQLWWARWISDMGFVVLFIDSYCTRGHLCAHSTGDDDKRRGEIMKNWDKVSLEQRMMDAAAGYYYLWEQSNIQKESIGLIGWSWGGTAALFIQKLATRIKLPNGGFKGTVAFYPNLMHVENHRMWRSSGKIGQPTLILYGKSDQLESVESYDKLLDEKHPGPIKVAAYEGAVRKFDELGPYRVKKHPRVGKFAKAYHGPSFLRSLSDLHQFLHANFVLN